MRSCRGLLGLVLLIAGCSTSSDGSPASGPGGAGGSSQSPGGRGGSGQSGGGSGSGNLCGTDIGGPPGTEVYAGGLTVRFNSLAHADTYDGAAVVERSTADELVLAFALPASTTDEPPQHVTISGLHPMPILPLGAQVWLTRQGDTETFDWVSVVPWAISIRDRQAGQILLGGFRVDIRKVAAPLPQGAPIAIGAVTPRCSVSALNSCEGATITYLDVEVLGDATVKIGHGQVQPVAVDGVSYDVSIQAWDVSGKPTADFCSDSVYTKSVGATVVAHDLTAAVAGLDVGQPLACSEGNGLPYRNVFFVLSGVSSSTTYEGPAIYRGVASTPADSYDFDVPGLQSGSGGSGGNTRLSIQNVGKVLAGTAVGTSFWVSIPSLSPRVLRESQQGPLVLADAQLPDPVAPNEPSAIAQTMGVSLTPEQRCVYAKRSDGGLVPLFDLTVGTDPPTHIKSGETGHVVVGDRAYDLEVQGKYAVNLFVSRSP